VNNVLSYWEMSSGQQVECYLDWLIKYMPRLLILDEPSSRIEKENLIKILLKIRKNNTKMSILLATHDNDLLKILDARVLTIIDGFVW
jgi:ABC-type ATPase involved in cell division